MKRQLEVVAIVMATLAVSTPTAFAGNGMAPKSGSAINGSKSTGAPASDGQAGPVGASKATGAKTLNGASLTATDSRKSSVKTSGVTK